MHESFRVTDFLGVCGVGMASLVTAQGQSSHPEFAMWDKWQP